MSNRGIRLPRPVRRLPTELVTRNSDLDVLITVASDATEGKTFGFASTVNVTRRLIRQYCGSYSPSSSTPHDVLCASGEVDGEPTLGSVCFRCRAGQFTASGMFTGETQGNVVPVTAVAADSQQLSTFSLSSFIRELEAS